MNKEDLRPGSIITDSKQIAFVIKILPNKIRVFIDGQKFCIHDSQLFTWKFANPIKDNRIVSNHTFAIRLKHFLEKIPIEWAMSQPHIYEEWDYLTNIAYSLLNYQIQTVTDVNEIEYLKRLKLL